MVHLAERSRPSLPCWSWPPPAASLCVPLFTAFRHGPQVTPRPEARRCHLEARLPAAARLRSFTVHGSFGLVVSSAAAPELLIDTRALARWVGRGAGGVRTGTPRSHPKLCRQCPTTRLDAQPGTFPCLPALRMHCSTPPCESLRCNLCRQCAAVHLEAQWAVFQLPSLRGQEPEAAVAGALLAPGAVWHRWAGL